MVDIKSLSPGDRVRIVSEWDWDKFGSPNRNGLMDKYLGTELTVDSLEGNAVWMVEDSCPLDIHDGRGWKWFPHMIECIVDEPDLSIQEMDEDIFLEMIGG